MARADSSSKNTGIGLCRDQEETGKWKDKKKDRKDSQSQGTTIIFCFVATD